MFRIFNTFAAAMALAAAASTAAQAQTHYFAQNNLLYSFSESNPAGTLSSPLTLTGLGTGTDGRVSGLAFDPSGTLWGANAAGRFFTINTTTGATTTKFPGTNSNTIATFDFRQNGSTLEILAAQTATGGVSNLRRYDASTGAQIGTDVSLGLAGAGTNNAGDPASGFDAATGKYYIVKGGAATGSTNDFTLRSYDFATSSFSGALQTNLQWASAGGAWFGGQMYFGYRPGADAGLGNWNLTSGATNDDIYFGTLNTATGAFSQLVKFDLSILPASAMSGTGPSFGYAVMAIPEPESYAMLLAGLGLIGAIARRRAAR
jgi:hypothetical protein